MACAYRFDSIAKFTIHVNFGAHHDVSALLSSLCAEETEEHTGGVGNIKLERERVANDCL